MSDRTDLLKRLRQATAVCSYIHPSELDGLERDLSAKASSVVTRDEIIEECAKVVPDVLGFDAEYVRNLIRALKGSASPAAGALKIKLPALPVEIQEWCWHMDTALEQDQRHQAMALAAAWPQVSEWLRSVVPPSSVSGTPYTSSASVAPAAGELTIDPVLEWARAIGKPVCDLSPAEIIAAKLFASRFTSSSAMALNEVGTKSDNAQEIGQAAAVDENARWKEIKRLSDAIARKDGTPNEIESALCGAVWRAKQWEEAFERWSGQREELYATIDALRAASPSTTALKNSEINDALDLAECCVHDQLKNPNEREWVQEILKKLRALALTPASTEKPIGWLWPDMIEFLQTSKVSGSVVNLYREQEDRRMVPAFLASSAKAMPISPERLKVVSEYLAELLEIARNNGLRASVADARSALDSVVALGDRHCLEDAITLLTWVAER